MNLIAGTIERMPKKTSGDGDGDNFSSSSAAWKAEEAVAGNSEALQALRELIIHPIIYSREAEIIGSKWPRSLLLYGPPGTGKTSLVRAVIQESGAHVVAISPQSVRKPHAGESEKALREAFAKAKSLAKSGKPSVIFIDEIDALCPHRDSRKEQDARIVSQLSVLMDSNKSSFTSESHVVVVASTNRVDAVDPALRRSGRFDSEIEVSTPNEAERLEILKLYTKELALDPNVDFKAIAASCNGYVGADLEALCREAYLIARKRSSNVNEDCESFIITMDDWKHASSVVGPSIIRGVTTEIPKVSWDDIGGLKDVKKKLQQAVEWPRKHSEAFARLGKSPIRGILLHGPPGCSKTTIAKAAANASQSSFFSLSCAQLYNMYVGEGEALLRNIFRKARLAAPSIIFFDEVDGVGAGRGGSSSNNSTSGERLLTTLLTEMDGLEQSKGVLVLAATNRFHAIDPALRRPGRFDLMLYVPPPDLEGRYDILRVRTRKMPLHDDVDLKHIAAQTDLFTGADLEGLCNEAVMAAVREDLLSAEVVCNRHFQTALKSRKPSLTRAEIDSYTETSVNKNNSSSPKRGSKETDSFRRLVVSIATVLIAVAIALCSVVLYKCLSLKGTYTMELART